MDNASKMKLMTEKKIWAVIGVTPNLDKKSNQIYHTLLDNGYETYPINPKYKFLENGEPCYPSLENLPKVPDCVDFVVPPPVTKQQLEAMDPAVIKNVWLQPGTYTDDILEYAESRGFTVVNDGACVMAYLNSTDR